jgi:hypothetical protein
MHEVPEIYEPNLKRCSEHQEFIGSEVAASITGGVLLQWPHHPRVVSQLAVMPKKGSQWQLIVNMCPLNQLLTRVNFHFKGLDTLASLIQEGDYMFTIDLTAAFWHMAIHPDSLNLMGVKWDSQYYMFSILPFSLSLSPWVFTKVGQQMVKVWHARGLCLVLYMDDLWVATSLQELVTWLAVQVCCDLGWTLNNDKSALKPLQVVTFLSFCVDSRSLEFVLPPDKELVTHQSISALLAQGRSSPKELLLIAGQLVAYQWAIEPVQLYMHGIFAAAAGGWADDHVHVMGPLRFELECT